jgi:hypothetical protein
MIWFLLWFFVGGFFGALAMAMAAATRDSGDREIAYWQGFNEGISEGKKL